MTSFYERPILNSPYAALKWHHPFDDRGQPLDGAPRSGRRPSNRSGVPSKDETSDGAPDRDQSRDLLVDV
ncbi:hypothetical protein ACQR16_15135 [Bradyrhizobium oligotrophicum]|uniref:hypothetical protein n=1 Tax=Bradyrhizobium oligotrophicum TaxID=44255 RepID=UPI003EBD9A0E